MDDDPALLDALSGTLQIHLGHFTLDTCDTGMKALDCVTAKHYDTIVSDLNMPSINGLQLLSRVREVRPLASVVLISGHADHALVSKAIDAGAVDVIVKPIARNIFISTVRQTLNLSRLRELLERQQARIGRTRDHYLHIIEKLGQFNETWLRFLDIPKAQSYNIPHDALIRQQIAKQQMEIFRKRATRHLAILDGFLFSRHASAWADFGTAQHGSRKPASSRLGTTATQ